MSNWEAAAAAYRQAATTETERLRIRVAELERQLAKVQQERDDLHGRLEAAYRLPAGVVVDK